MGSKANYPQPFDEMTTYPGHGGLDYPKPTGTPAPAIRAGVITYAGVWGRGGLTKTLTLPNGLQIMYCHLDSLQGPGIGAGVRYGQMVGPVGSTGFSTGPHLHIEMWLRGVAQVEYDWLDMNNWVGKSQPAGNKPVASTPVNEASEEDEMNVVLYLYTPTNNLLLVDHMAKTIRELGSNTTYLRDYYSKKQYVPVGDAEWASVTRGYKYI